MGAKNIDSRQSEELRVVTSQENKMIQSEGESSGLERMREILVGNYLRETERRSERLEKRLAEDTGHVRHDLMQRIEALETRMQEEHNALQNRYKEERGARLQEFERLTEAVERLEKDLRQHFQQQTKMAANDLHRVRSELLARIDEDKNLLDHGKVDRSLLASMLAEVIARLTTSGEAAPTRQ